MWDSSSEWKSSKDAYPQAPMKIIKPLAGGFIIGEIFPKFRIGLLRDRNKYSRWWRKCKYFGFLLLELGFIYSAGSHSVGSGRFLSLYVLDYEEFPQISHCPTHDDYVARWIAEAYPSGLWDSSGLRKSSKDAYPQAPMKIIKPPGRGFIIWEIFPKFLDGLLRDQGNYSRW